MIIFQTTGTLRNQSQGWFWVCPQLRTFWKLFQKKMLSVSSTMGILRIQSAGRCVISPQSLEFGYSSLLEDVEGITFSPIWAVDPFLLRSNALERPTLLWPGVLRNISSIQLRKAPTGKKQLYVGFFLGRGKVELFFFCSFAATIDLLAQAYQLVDTALQAPWTPRMTVMMDFEL